MIASTCRPLAVAALVALASATPALAQKAPAQSPQPAAPAPSGETAAQQVARLNAEGEAAFQRRDYDAAVRAFDAALAIYIRVAGVNDARTAMAAVNLGEALLGAGRYADAEEVFASAETILTNLGYGADTLAPIQRARAMARQRQAGGPAAAGPARTGSAPSAGGGAADPLDALNEQAVARYRAGDLAQAETGFLDLLSRLEDAGRGAEEFAGVAWVNLGEVYTQQSRLEEAINAIERARAIFTALDPAHRYIAVVENNLSAVRRRQGDSAQAVDGYQSAYQAMSRSFGETHPNTLSALGNYANALIDLGRGREAQGPLEAAIAAAGDAPGGDLAMLRSHLGEIYLELGAWEQAVEQQRLAVSGLEQDAQTSRGDLAQVRRRLGRALTLAGRPVEAEAVLLEAVSEAEQVFGAGAAETIMAQTLLATTLFDQARFDEAEALQRSALAAAEALPGEGDNLMASAIESNLAGTLRFQGRYDDAEALYRSSLAAAERGGNAGSIATSLENLAGIVRIQGRLGEAAQLQVRAISLYEDVYGPDHPETIRAYGTAGTTLGLAGEHAEAERLLRLGLEGLERRLPDRHVMVLVARSNLAWLYLRHAGRPADALDLYREATGSIVQASLDDSALDDAAGAAVVRRRADIFTLHVEAAWAVAEGGQP
ncbi:MAG: tetratricopeptide repeat protein [Alphaproteobacteria bacterium]|nr:tetratricopeptide repeat protein [Alphaproteobacteria bacterium]